jgi:hypothetical protein
LPPPVITDRTAALVATTHMLCCSCGIYFSAAPSSERPGQHELGLEHRACPFNPPSRVAAIHLNAGCLTCRCTSVTTCRS